MRYARVEGIGIISYWEFRRLTPRPGDAPPPPGHRDQQKPPTGPTRATTDRPSCPTEATAEGPPCPQKGTGQ